MQPRPSVFSEGQLLSCRRATKYKLRVPAGTPSGYSSINSVSPARYAKFERSITDLLNVGEWGQSRGTLDPTGEVTLFDKIPGDRRELTGIFMRRDGLDNLSKRYRPRTSKNARIRRLTTSDSFEEDLECRIAEIISGHALDEEREEPEPLTGLRRMESPITDLDSVSERLPHDVSPRVITVVLAGDERPRKSIQLFLNQRNMKSLRQVLRGVSDILSPHNPVTSLYGAISMCEVYSIGDLYEDDTIFIGFPRTDSELLMSQFALHPKEVQTVKAYCRLSPQGQRVTLKTPIYPSPLSSQMSSEVWLSKYKGLTVDDSPPQTAPSTGGRRSDRTLRLPTGDIYTARSTPHEAKCRENTKEKTATYKRKQKAYRRISIHTSPQRAPLNLKFNITPSLSSEHQQSTLYTSASH